MIRKLTALALGASTVLAASSASAQSAAQEKARAFAEGPGWSIAGLLGLGFSSYAGFGIGFRGGYTLPSGVYLGGTFIDFPGSWGNTFLTGFEGGYNIPAGPIVVRPYGGLGLIDITYPVAYNGCGTAVINGVVVNNGLCGNVSSTYFSLWFGGTVEYPITPNWFVGGDLRFLIIPSVNAYAGSGFTGALMGTGGYQF